MHKLIVHTEFHFSSSASPDLNILKETLMWDHSLSFSVLYHREVCNTNVLGHFRFKNAATLGTTIWEESVSYVLKSRAFYPEASIMKTVIRGHFSVSFFSNLGIYNLVLG